MAAITAPRAPRSAKSRTVFARDLRRWDALEIDGRTFDVISARVGRVFVDVEAKDRGNGQVRHYTHHVNAFLRISNPRA